jgi:2-oxoglutarate ferredoxin oxidoreductase subunit delta
MAVVGTPADVATRAASTVWTPLLIAAERCKGCELCVAACPKDCLSLDLSIVNALGHHPVMLTDASLCTSCAFCARVCPDAVFTVFAAPRKGRP